MTPVTIHRAWPVGDQEIQDVEISIIDPARFDPAAMRGPTAWMDGDADLLARHLIASLPGGTLHRLTARLLIHMAGTLVVPSRTLAALAAE